MYKFGKIFTINLLVLLGILSTLEIISRLFFPELNNQVTVYPRKMLDSGKTNGLFFHRGILNNEIILNRAITPKQEINTTDPVFLIMGDSVTFGIGTAYADLYYRRMERTY